MPSLLSATTALTPFSDNENAKQLLAALRAIPHPFSENAPVAVSAVESARRICLSILKNTENETVTSGSSSLTTAAYSVALALAEACPINPIDPITQEEFQSTDSVVFVSDGHRFIVDALKQYIEHNGFYNPFNRQPLFSLDKKTVSDVTGIALDYQPSAPSYEMDPLTVDAIAAAQAFFNTQVQTTIAQETQIFLSNLAGDGWEWTYRENDALLSKRRETADQHILVILLHLEHKHIVTPIPSMGEDYNVSIINLNELRSFDKAQFLRDIDEAKEVVRELTHGHEIIDDSGFLSFNINELDLNPVISRETLNGLIQTNVIGGSESNGRFTMYWFDIEKLRDIHHQFGPQAPAFD